jgi:hypothetical protein
MDTFDLEGLTGGRRPWLSVDRGARTCVAAVRAGIEDNGAVTVQPDPDAEWWTTSDVAAYLGVRVGTVSSYRLREQMPAPDLLIFMGQGLGLKWRSRW